MSERASAGCPSACSGDMYAEVPSTVAVCVSEWLSSARAIPKSSTFTCPSGVTMMLPGLMSRWTIPAACAALSASATCAAIRAARAGSSGPSSRRMSARLRPGTSSITMKRVGPSAPAS